LFLEKGDGTADRVSGHRLLAGFRRLAARHLPYLTFLSACESAARSKAAQDRFAQVLARELALPAVIGMVDPITVDAAEKLTTSFYRRLRVHGLPDMALAESRAGLFDQHDVLVPVLISQLGSQPLFDEAIDLIPTDPEAITQGRGVVVAP
jgi:hypothetical protein